ncbi:MAG: ribose 5-phosphate isomerase A [Planctomycetota bacterium]
MAEQPAGGEVYVDELAEAALATVENDMLIGIGAGRTTARFVAELGARVKDGLDIQVVAGSLHTEQRCREAGLTVLDFATVDRLDLLLDGADEVDPQMRMLKGSRGAIARERILAWAADHALYAVRGHKLSECVGTNAALSVAVMPFGLASTRAAVGRAGLNGVVRLDMDGAFLVTDNGNLILDVALSGDEDFEQLGAELNAIPGVIEHGLFIGEADTILVEHDDGSIERLER